MKMLSVGILIVDRDYFCGHCLYLVSRTGVKLFNRTLYLVSLFSRSSELSDCLLRLWWLWWRDWHGARGVSLQRTTTRNEGAESLIGIKKCSSIFHSTGQSKQHLIKKNYQNVACHCVACGAHVRPCHVFSQCTTHVCHPWGGPPGQPRPLLSQPLFSQEFNLISHQPRHLCSAPRISHPMAEITD